jgi:hypothetical protein
MKPNIYDNGSKDIHFEQHLKMQYVPLQRKLKIVCPHRVYKLATYAMG